MQLTSSPIELTTAASDGVLAVLCLVLLASLMRMPVRAPWKKAIWASVFVLLATGSALGAVAHGLDWPTPVKAMLWKPLYLSLGLSVAMFFVGGIGDWRDERAARAMLPWALAAGAGFFALMQISSGAFGVFIVYEAAVMVATLLMYFSLWKARTLAGAGRVTLGIAMTLVAAAIQVSSLSVRIIWLFDHNGLFHLVQIAAVLTVADGLRASMNVPRAS